MNLIETGVRLNYCVVLYIGRTAQKQEIVKAYRKLAAQWHPDQYNGDDKSHAEKMFIDIAAAKEVLSDTGKSQYFNTMLFFRHESLLAVSL